MIEKFLKIILRLSGTLLVLAFIAVFLPYEIMDNIHHQMGLGKLPQTPIVDYLARSVSLFYGIHGILVLYISFDIAHYAKFLKLLSLLGVMFGITIFIIDINANMPTYWSYSEGILVSLLNLLVYILIIVYEQEKSP